MARRRANTSTLPLLPSLMAPADPMIAALASRTETLLRTVQSVERVLEGLAEADRLAVLERAMKAVLRNGNG